MSASNDRPTNFTDLAFTPTVRRLQEERGSRAGYERMGQQAASALDWRATMYLQERDSFYMSTVGENGWPYVQHRGGPPGFVRVIDEQTLAFADFRGNKQYISTGNIIDNQRVAMIFMDYPNQRRLKVWALATVMSATDDPALAAAVELPDYAAKVERIFNLEVVGLDWNCPQHITPRFTAAEIEALKTL
ncbi:MAG: pyridoxamine 5-phosphate oxidase [Acidobacteria bacterium]|nr:pyridoxamine 5-phosphate oxidase [Acidobacteriota bacterium]